MFTTHFPCSFWDYDFIFPILQRGLIIMTHLKNAIVCLFICLFAKPPPHGPSLLMDNVPSERSCYAFLLAILFSEMLPRAY